jgi:hypothetical protein
MILLGYGKYWLPVVQSKDAFQPLAYAQSERIVNRILENLANRVTDQTSVAKPNDSGKMVEVSK